MKTKVSARKELRKAKRDSKKRKRVEPQKVSSTVKEVAAAVSIEAKSQLKKVSKRPKAAIPLSIDETDEDRDIKRLEKLLGVADRSKAAAKLNREYEMYEGIGGTLGSFLMSLDKIGDSKRPSKRK